MRKTLESGIPDTAPYKEWLEIVGTMALAGCSIRFRAIRHAARGPATLWNNVARMSMRAVRDLILN
jgi:hypothetical protein